MMSSFEPTAAYRAFRGRPPFEHWLSGIAVRTCYDFWRARPHQPEAEQALTLWMAEIKTKLSAEQQAKLDKLYAKLQRRWQISNDYLQTTRERLKHTK